MIIQVRKLPTSNLVTSVESDGARVKQFEDRRSLFTFSLSECDHGKLVWVTVIMNHEQELLWQHHEWLWLITHEFGGYRSRTRMIPITCTSFSNGALEFICDSESEWFANCESLDKVSGCGIEVWQTNVMRVRVISLHFSTVIWLRVSTHQSLGHLLCSLNGPPY